MFPKRTPWPILLVAFALLADLSYSRVLPLGTGLDPSWANAITRAAQLHLTFGRTIVFTYGPLGYLIVGTGLPGMFPQIFAARIGLALIFSAFVIYYCARLEFRRFLIAISTIVTAAFIIRGYLAAAPITAMVAISVLTLDRRSKHQAYEAVLIGVLAGLASLAKFTLGVQFLAAVGAVLLLQAIAEVRTSRLTRRANYSLGAFIVSGVATACAALMGSTRPIFLCISLWTICIACLVVTISSRRQSTRIAIIAPAVLILTTLLIVELSDAKDFFANSIQISIGYSSAMNIFPASHAAEELSIGLLLTLLLSLVTISQRSELSVGAILGLTLLGWLNFKEGYVREGPGHAIEYFIPMVLIFAVMTMSSPTRRTLSLSILAFSVALFCFTVKTFETNPLSKVYSLARLLAPGQDVREAFGTPGSEDKSSSGFDPDVFDDGSAARLRSLPVDVQPTETTVAFANGLNWSPEPVFQSISAYTPALDLINAESLAAGNRRVLVDYATIDGRNFMAESPLARHELLCDYDLDPHFGRRLAHVKSGEQFAVLSVASSGRCHRIGDTRSEPITWDRAYSLPATRHDVLTFLALDLPYSIQGTIMTTLFRGPEVRIDIFDRSGVVMTSRILPANVVNGFLVNPNPTNLDRLVRLFEGDLDPTSRMFAIHTNEPGMFGKQLHATISTFTYSRN